jgi:hypothetical protein
MIEVFKTNVDEAACANRVVDLLLQHFPNSRINIDLHDCDKILRVEAEAVNVQTIVMLVRQHGFACSILE